MAGGSPFAQLGLPPTASVQEVKAAYRHASRKLHPDVGGDERAFHQMSQAAAEALEYASGAKPNPYLPRDGPPEHRIVWEEHYDRHRHSPPPPPNPWRNPWLGGGLFWILPVMAGIFMLSGATGPYFIPVFLGATMVFGLIVWVAMRVTNRPK